MDVSAIISGTTERTIGIVGKAIDDNTRLGLFITNAQTGSCKAELWLKYPGTNAYFAEATVANVRAGNNVVRFRAIGNVLTGYIDGKQVVSYTMTPEQVGYFNTSANWKAGLRCSSLVAGGIAWSEVTVRTV